MHPANGWLRSLSRPWLTTVIVLALSVALINLSTRGLRAAERDSSRRVVAPGPVEKNYPGHGSLPAILHFRR